MKLFPLHLAATLLTLSLVASLGCGDSTSETPAPEPAKPVYTVNSEDENETEWLSLPEEIDLETGQEYVTVRSMAQLDDLYSMANLGAASQELAFEIAKAKNEDAAFAFLRQSATTLRTAAEGGLEDIPPEMLSQTYYFEAVALAHIDELEAALGALDQAVDAGFKEFGLLADEDGLKEVRETAKYKQLHSKWIAAMVKDELFPFELNGTSVQGDDLSLNELRGKVLIVDIWGTWCPPCVGELPSFVKLQDKFGKDGFQMIGVNFERGVDEEQNLKSVQKAISNFELNYPCLLGDDSIRAQIPRFEGYPTTLFIGKDGAVRHMEVGAHPYEYLESIVKALLAEDA